MTKTFDSICQKILGETLMSATPKPGQAPNPAQPNQQQGTSPNAPNQPAQQNDTELAKAFETLTKHAANNQDHIKAITALQQLLTAQQQNATQQQNAVQQQQNATNKPA
jgi:hypothetical protein